MLTRITITLAEDERTALQAIARDEIRPLKDQIRHMLREAAARRGLMPAEATKDAHYADESALAASSAVVPSSTEPSPSTTSADWDDPSLTLADLENAPDEVQRRLVDEVLRPLGPILDEHRRLKAEESKRTLKERAALLAVHRVFKPAPSSTEPPPAPLCEEASAVAAFEKEYRAMKLRGEVRNIEEWMRRNNIFITERQFREWRDRYGTRA